MSTITIAEFAATLGHNHSELVDRMKKDGVLQQFGRPYQVFINSGHFVVDELAQRRFTVAITGKGQVWLARKYPHGTVLSVTP
jgi:phage antirepressor YoqD-like protein